MSSPSVDLFNKIKDPVTGVVTVDNAVNYCKANFKLSLSTHFDLRVALTKLDKGKKGTISIADWNAGYDSIASFLPRGPVKPSALASNPFMIASASSNPPSSPSSHKPVAASKPPHAPPFATPKPVSTPAAPSPPAPLKSQTKSPVHAPSSPTIKPSSPLATIPLKAFAPTPPPPPTGSAQKTPQTIQTAQATLNSPATPSGTLSEEDRKKADWIKKFKDLAVNPPSPSSPKKAPASPVLPPAALAPPPAPTPKKPSQTTPTIPISPAVTTTAPIPPPPAGAKGASTLTAKPAPQVVTSAPPPPSQNVQIPALASTSKAPSLPPSKLTVPIPNSPLHPSAAAKNPLPPSLPSKLPREERPTWKANLKEAALVLQGEKPKLNERVYKQLIEGEAKIEGIPHPKKVVRVFISSTFTDTEAERNLLMTDVFPYLSHLCHLLSVQFEVVDMRWGVREFTNDDHGTFNLCMSELHKCRRESMGPAFFCLLGDKYPRHLKRKLILCDASRYGFRPFPNKIEQVELEKMWKKIKEEEIDSVNKELPPHIAAKVFEISDVAKAEKLSNLWDSFDDESRTALTNSDLMLIARWYKLDTNCVPPSYVLQAITVFIPEFRSADETLRRAAGGRWWKIFEELAFLLRIGAAALPKSQQEKYFISVTEAEVHNGILLNNERHSQSFCCRRQIENAVEFPSSIASRGKFVDLFPDKKIDIHELKMKKVSAALPASNIRDYSVSPTVVSGENLSAQEQSTRDLYLASFADNFCWQMVKAIFAGYAATQIVTTPLINELIQQHTFRAGKCTNLTVREDTLAPIMSYLTSDRPTAHVVWGDSGSGKTSLMAIALQRIKEKLPKAFVIYRFIGVTASSSGARQLMHSVYSQIAELLASIKDEEDDQLESPKKEDSDSDGDGEEDDHNVYETPLEFRYLVKYFPALLAKAKRSRPVIIFLDSLDQLSDEDSGRSLRWLPFVLPPHVHLVVSVLPVLLDTVKALHNGGDECYTNVPAMNLQDGLPIMREWLQTGKRTLTNKQQEVIMKAFVECPLPLFLRVATDIAIKWPSYLHDESCKLETDLPNLIANSIFREIELVHGEKLVSHALGYITASKEGLSYNELEDILSCDEDVLSDVYQWWTPPVRVLPPMLWKRIREDLGGYLVERGSSDAVVYRWYHRQFWEAAELRYLRKDFREVPLPPIGDGKVSHSQKQARHIAMAKYFNGDWSSPNFVPYIGKSGAEEKTDRLISKQPLEFAETVFNIRKLTELPYHQTLGNLVTSYDSTLFNFNFIAAKCTAKLHYDLLRDYKFALQNIVVDSKSSWKHCLQSFHDFLMHTLVKHPKMAIQLALNGPDADQVSLDAKIQSLYSTQPIMNWVNKSQDLDPCTKTYAAHTGSVDCFDLTKDETKIATASWDKTIKICNFENGEEIATLNGHTDTVNTVKFFAEGRLVISSSDDQTLRVWDAHSGALNATYTGHELTVTQCDAALDGSIAISSSEDKTVRVWDLNLRKCVAVLSDHVGEVWSCAISPTGDIFASSGEDGIIIWSASSYKLLYRLQGHKLATGRVSFTDDAKYLLSTSTDHKCIIWDLKIQQQVKSIPFACRNITQFSCALSPDGNRLAIGVNEALRVYNVTDGKLSSTLSGHEDHISKVQFTRDGKHIVTSSWDNTVKVWDATAKQTKRDNRVHNGMIASCTYSPDGNFLATASSDKTIKIWYPDIQLEVKTLDMKSKVEQVTYSRDGNFMLVRLNGKPYASIIEVDSGEIKAEYKGHLEDEELTGAAFSPDENLIASTSWDKTLRIFDRHTTHEIAKLEGGKAEMGCVAFSPDGKKLVSGGWDGVTIVWDVNPPHNQLLKLQDHGDSFITACAFSPDGKLVASGADTDKRICVWDATTGELQHSLEHSSEVLSFRFLSNQRIFSVTGHAVHLFDFTLSNPCFALFLHPYNTEFCSAAIRDEQIIAFDNTGGIYYLKVDNTPPEMVVEPSVDS